MPATTLRLDDTVTHAIFRQWVVTPAAQDTAAGSAVNVTIDQTTGGATPPNQPQTLTLRAVTDAGTDIRSVTLDPALATQTVAFTFSSDGTGTGTARCGTVELVLHAIRTGAGSYDVESDGTPNTPPAGFHTHTATRGWCRGTTSLVEDISNTSLGGAPDAPAAYDESLFIRTTAGAVSYVARALTVSTSAGSLSGSTNSTTAVTRDITFANVCDERFPAASTTVTVSVSVPNATLTGQPDWAFTSTTDDTIDVDPRLTETWHLQVNDSVFGTAKPTSTSLRGSQDIGYMWVRLTNARGVGVNGVTVLPARTDPNGATTAGGSNATTTLDGEAGWKSTSTTWSDVKPSGVWTFSATATAPSDIDSAGYLVGSTDFTLLNQNTDYHIFGSLGPLTSVAQDHWKPGDPLLIGAALFDTSTDELDLVTPNTSTGKAPAVALGRFAADGTVEYLGTDLVTWTDLPTDGSGSVARLTMTRADLFDGNGDTTPDLPSADPRVYLLLIPATTAFAYTTVFGLLLFHDTDGNRYAEHFALDPLGSANPHSAWTFDPTGTYK